MIIECWPWFCWKINLTSNTMTHMLESWLYILTSNFVYYILRCIWWLVLKGLRHTKRFTWKYEYAWCGSILAVTKCYFWYIVRTGYSLYLQRYFNWSSIGDFWWITYLVRHWPSQHCSTVVYTLWDVVGSKGRSWSLHPYWSRKRCYMKVVVECPQL